MSKVENINEYYRKLFNYLDDFKDSKEETEFFIYIIFKSLAFYQNKEFLPECKDSLSKSQKSFFSLRKKIFENLIDISFNESINDIYQFLNNLIDSEEEIFLQNYKRIFKHLKNVKKWNEEIYLKNFAKKSITTFRCDKCDFDVCNDCKIKEELNQDFSKLTLDV